MLHGVCQTCTFVRVAWIRNLSHGLVNAPEYKARPIGLDRSPGSSVVRAPGIYPVDPGGPGFKSLHGHFTYSPNFNSFFFNGT
jgi:hypothetical protein